MIRPFKYYFYPFLWFINKNGPTNLKNVSAFIGRFFDMTYEDLNELTNGGATTKHGSRINYCASYLKKLGLVESPKSGVYLITKKGKQLLSAYGASLTLDNLKDLPEYIEVQKGKKNVVQKRVLIEGHYRGDKYVPPYFCNINQLSKDKQKEIKGK